MLIEAVHEASAVFRCPPIHLVVLVVEDQFLCFLLRGTLWVWLAILSLRPVLHRLISMCVSWMLPLLMGLLILLKRVVVVRESVLFKRTHITKVLPRLLQCWRLLLSFSKATALHHCFHPTISLPVATTHGFFFDLWTIVHLWFLIYHEEEKVSLEASIRQK